MERHSADHPGSGGPASSRLTNLLSARCTARLETADHVDIFLLLGLGDRHGEAAIRWTVERLYRDFTVRVDGEERRVVAFGEGRRTVFPDDIGLRTAYRFDVSDQHVIPRTLGVRSAATWLCLDPSPITELLAVSGKLGLSRLLRSAATRELLVKLLGSVRFGSDRFAVKVEAMGSRGGRDISVACTATGRGEARATALVAAEVASALDTVSLPRGVHHIEQLFDPDEIMCVLQRRGVTIRDG